MASLVITNITIYIWRVSSLFTLRPIAKKVCKTIYGSLVLFLQSFSFPRRSSTGQLRLRWLFSQLTLPRVNGLKITFSTDSAISSTSELSNNMTDEMVLFKNLAQAYLLGKPHSSWLPLDILLNDIKPSGIQFCGGYEQRCPSLHSRHYVTF